jgi:ABC-type Zn uptake system ZnuABC Zn-binding protein ZnuA
MQRFEGLLCGLAAVGALCASGLATHSIHSRERLRVLATLPDLADLASEIGGERVQVDSIARGKENLHAISARPSHLVAMSKADLFLEIGLSLEVAFVPGLLETCRNPRVQPGAVGFVMVSEGWDKVAAPTVVSRRAGDIHPQGNPHMNLDPRAGAHMARKICEGLARVDPKSAELYASRRDDYLARLEAAQARWSKQAQGWPGKRIAVYHVEFDYLAQVHGLEIVGSLEEKPGLPPTPKHLAELIGRMREQGVKVVVTAPWSNNAHVKRVAEETGAQVVVLPNQCGGVSGAETWLGMMDLIHARLAAALGTSDSPQ